MSRFSRKARRPRSRRSRRNTGQDYGLVGSDLVELGRTADGPSLVLFPTNPISLRWAAEAYTLQKGVPTYQKNVMAFLEQVVDREPTVVEEVMTDNGLNEEALAPYVVKVLSDREADPALVALARDVFSNLGTFEELAAIEPFPNFGLLQGQGILDAGITPRGKGDPLSALKDRVLSLDNKVKLARVGVGYPVEEVGQARGGQLFAVFVAMGPWDDPEGMALQPIASTREAAARAAAGVVRAILARGLWDVRTGQWAEGSRVHWTLPEPDFSRPNQDATRSRELANFVCVRQQTYSGPGVELTVAYSPTGESVVGELVQQGQAQTFRGSFDRKQNAYQTSVSGTPSLLALSAEVSMLTVGNEALPLQLVSSGRMCPHPETKFLLEPPAIGWLRSGVDLLRQRPSQAEMDVAGIKGSDYELVSSILARLLNRPLARGEVDRILAAFGSSLSGVTMDFLGRRPAEDGVPRYLPAEGPVSWYGAPSFERSLAALRMGKRAQLTGTRKRKGQLQAPPMPLLAMQLMGQRGMKPFSGHLASITALREDLTAARAAEEEDLAAFERKVWKEGTAAGKPRTHPAAIQLEGDSALCSVVFSLCGVVDGGTYDVLWQSSPLSLGQIESVVQITRQQLGERGEDDTRFDPTLGFRWWLARESGLLAVTGGVDIPYTFVASMLVDQKRIQRRVDRDRLPKALDVGEGLCNGRRTQLGLMMTRIEIPMKTVKEKAEDGKTKSKRVVNTEALEAVHTADTMPDGLVPVRPTASDYWAVTENLVKVGITAQRTLLPLVGTPWGKGPLLTLGNISRTTQYAQAVEDATEAGREVEPAKIYAEIVREAVLARPLGGSGGSVIAGGRRAYQAFGGAQGRAVKKMGRLVSQDASQRVWATKTSPFFSDIFALAASVCRQTGCPSHGPRRTESAGVRKQWAEALSDVKADENEVVRKLAEYGILAEVDLEDPVSLRAGLVKLRDALRPEYQHETRTGLLSQQLQEQAQIAQVAVAPFLLENYLDAGGEEVQDFAPAYLDKIAKLNGRRHRRARRPRRSARRNPLSRADVEAAIEYADNQTKERSPGALPGSFDRLTRESPPADWDLTRDRVDSLFPREFKGQGTWRPVNRLPALEKYNLVSRVGGLDPASAVVRAGRQAAADARGMPVDNEAIRALMLAEAGLSLDEAVRILAAQRGKKSTGFTMTPSSAICKMYRSRRLTAYSPPKQVLDQVGNHGILLWMSPSELYRPRVMSFRRDTHIDCDLVGDSPEEMPEILGKSLQSAMFWVVEKPRRLPVTDVWVGRVGQPDLYLALRRGETVSLAQAASNLRKAEEGVEGYRRSIFNSTSEYEVVRKKDIAEYLRAVRTQIGPDAAEEVGQWSSAVRRAEPAEPAAPAASFEAAPEPFAFLSDDEPY